MARDFLARSLAVVTVPFGDLPDGLVRTRLDVLAIEREFDAVRHVPVPVFRNNNLGFAARSVNWTLYRKGGVFGGWAAAGLRRPAG